MLNVKPINTELFMDMSVTSYRGSRNCIRLGEKMNRLDMRDADDACEDMHIKLFTTHADELYYEILGAEEGELDENFIKPNQKIAELHLKLFDMSDYDKGSRVNSIADEFDADTSDAVGALKKAGMLYALDESEYIENMEQTVEFFYRKCVVYIARIYVEPKFRGIGVANMLLENLQNILLDRDIIVRYAVTLINPQTSSKMKKASAAWKNMNMRMERLFTYHGFKHLGGNAYGIDLIPKYIREINERN